MKKNSWRRKARWSATLAMVVAFVIILVSPAPSYGNRWIDIIIQGIQVLQITNLSDEQEVQLGQEINQSLLSQGEIRLSRNREINNYIEEIGRRLAPRSGRPGIPYTFQVVVDNNVNAFATMGGYVYINTGLIKTAANEAELASVMAHEIGHIVGKHSLEQMRQTAITKGLLTAAGLDQSTAVQLGVEVALTLPNSRQAELEADQLGLQNLTAAGYAPIAMVDFMETLMTQGGATLTILSTHPATGDRITALEAAINPQTAQQGDGLDKKAYQRRIRSLL